MINFQNGTNYTFGVLGNNSSPNDLNPIFKQNTQRITMTGKKLKDLGIRSFDDYLESPECQFKATETVCCFEDVFDTQGYNGLKLVARGNPIRTNKTFIDEFQSNSLNDNTSIIRSQIENTNNSNNRDVVRMFQEQIASLQSQLTLLQSENTKIINRSIKEQQESINKIGALETEKIKLSIENETLKGLLDKYDTKSTGLNDAMQTGLASLLGNPMVGNVIGNILGGLAGKFIPMNNGNNQIDPQSSNPPENQINGENSIFPQMQGVM